MLNLNQRIQTTLVFILTVLRMVSVSPLSSSITRLFPVASLMAVPFFQQRPRQFKWLCGLLKNFNQNHILYFLIPYPVFRPSKTIKILQLHDELAISQFEVVFCWLPGNVGIKGTQMADTAAKSAHIKTISSMRIPYSDSKPAITSYIKGIRQSKWDLEVNNKLNKVHLFIQLAVVTR